MTFDSLILFGKRLHKLKHMFENMKIEKIYPLPREDESLIFWEFQNL